MLDQTNKLFSALLTFNNNANPTFIKFKKCVQFHISSQQPAENIHLQMEVIQLIKIWVEVTHVTPKD